MKSKSFDFKRSSADMGKHNKTFDFISLYKSTAGSSNVGVNESRVGVDKENSSQNESPRRGSSVHKKKKVKHEPLDISRINIEGPSLQGNVSKNSPLNQSKVTSTPRTSSKEKSPVKSIMKNSSVDTDNTKDKSQIYHSSKPKKRNKSVSFMLDDNEDVVPKKTKSDESLGSNKKKSVKPSKAAITQEMKLKKNKKRQIEKAKVGDTSIETDPGEIGESKLDSAAKGDVAGPSVSIDNKKQQKKKKNKFKKNTVLTNSESNDNEEATDNKNKKAIKKKYKEKPTKPTDVEVDEPAAKSRKKEIKPEAIAENLENLTIGDNPHTLTSLLDGMTVADKVKKKKSKRKQKQNNVQTSTETETSENSKEKVKWTKKWNKAKKHEIGKNVALSVIVENLPLTLICSYKTVLAEHFDKCGVIKKIGIAEVYPNESSTGFTTTILFESDAAATQALSEDGAVISGNKIHVKRALPPQQTTLVVRSYASLSDQAVCTTFSAEKIRSIRRLLKGKKSIETVFIEFDGPEAVERAIELTKGAKVAGKKIHVAKFEIKKKKKVKAPKTISKEPNDSDGEADSEDSND